MALLNRDDLVAALTRMGQLAAREAQTIELLIVGGGVMVLEFASRDSTQDLDGVVTNSIEPSKIRDYASAVAMEKGWPTGWLNDGAKGFLAGTISPNTIFTSTGITVSRPEYEQLLAMKLCAWRDDVDISDAKRLLKELPDNREKTWLMVTPFLQPGRELKARYAFDDLWEMRE